MINSIIGLIKGFIFHNKDNAIEGAEDLFTPDSLYPLEEDYLLMDFKELRQYSGFMSEELHDHIIRSSKRLKISVNRSDYDYMVARKKEYNDETKLLNDCAALNNQGMAYEKEGNIDAAIECYENNILPECSLSHKPYERLTIIYHKLKRYDDEIRVCNLYMSKSKYEDEIQKYRNRKEKAELLKLKQTINGK